MTPTKIKKISATELSILWGDAHEGRHTMQTLRKCCPCAGCKQERETNEGMITLPVLRPGEFDLRAIQPVGNYALQLIWGDGHQTGIYTFDYLREICECKECIKKNVE